jgi:hypothetical protein
MTRKIFGPRKRRTPEHVIEDQSVNHVERFIIDEGYTVQRMASDYGYDLAMFTYDQQGYVEPGSILIQLKARKSMQAVGGHFVFHVDIRDLQFVDAGGHAGYFGTF